MFVLILAAVLLALTISEYSPIAEKLVEQDHAVDAWIHEKDAAPLQRLREETLTRERRKQDSVRNDSIVLLLFSLLTDLGGHTCGKREGMALSIQAIFGAIIGSVVFTIGLATWIRDRRNDNAPDGTPTVSPIDKRPAVHL